MLSTCKVTVITKESENRKLGKKIYVYESHFF